MLRLPPGREGRRPLGRHPGPGDRRAVAARHDGARLLGHEGPGGDGAGPRPLARLARLRRARCDVLAGVRAAGQGPDHRPAAAGPPGRACSRSTSRSIGTSSPTSIGWPWSWPARGRPGSPARGRPTTRSRSASTRASCCAASTRSTAASGSSSTTRSPAPLGIDVYIRLPESIPNARLATLAPPGRMEMLLGFPLRLTLDSMNRRSNIYRALVTNPGTALPPDAQRSTRATSRCRRAAASAPRAPSRRPTACSRPVAASSGCARETLDALAAPAIPPTHGFHDECMNGDAPVLARVHEAEPGHPVRRPPVRSARPAPAARWASPIRTPASATAT